MRVSVQITVSAVALISTGILAAPVASAAISTDRQQQYRPTKAAGENHEPSEAGAVKARPAAGPQAGTEASQGGTSRLRGAAR